MTQQDRVLTYSYDFQPGGEFDVAAELETSTTVRMLQTADEETVSEISQPDEYTGYLVRYDIGETNLPAFLFVRGGTLSTDDSGTMSNTASVFSTRLNLMETSLE